MIQDQNLKNSKAKTRRQTQKLEGKELKMVIKYDTISVRQNLKALVKLRRLRRLIKKKTGNEVSSGRAVSIAMDMAIEAMKKEP